MKLKKRLISLILIIATALSAFTACDSKESKPNDEDTASEKDAVSFPEDAFPIFKDSEYLMDVVMPDKATEVELAIAARICSTIKSKTGQELTSNTDYLTSGASYDSGKYEILIGKTAHEEVKTLQKSIPYSSYGIKTVGKKIIFFFTTREQGLELTKIFFNAVENDDNGNLWIAPDFSTQKISSAQLSALPLYPSSSTTVVDCDEDTEMLVATATTLDEFKAYCASLESNGYVEYSKRDDVEGNYFYTYTKDNTALTVYFSNSRLQTRIIAGPLKDIPSKEIDSTPETYKPTLTMVAQGESFDNGLALIYMLPNGKFLVVDGGYFLTDKIYKKFCELQPGKTDFTVAAWFVSHPHTDHQETLEKVIDQRGHNINIESIFYNYVTPEYYADTSAEGDTGHGPIITRLRNLIAERLGSSTKVIKPHTGQIYKFGPSAEVEIIFTIEDYLPTKLDRMNTSSMIIRITVNGYSTMVLADATSVTNEIILKMFNTHLKSDAVTLAHHGVWVDTPQIYEKIDAKLLLWPSNTTSSRSYYKQDYSKPAIEAALTTATDVFLSKGKDITLPIPYEPIGNRDEFWEYLKG